MPPVGAYSWQFGILQAALPQGIGVGNIDARPLAWHDLLTMYRFRNEVQCLDTALGLTRGNPIGPWAMLDYLHLENGKTTAVLRQGGGAPTLIGQMRYASGEQAAHLAFALPAAGLNSPGVVNLVESLTRQAGARGAYCLLAEAEEDSPILEGLRRAGFSLYAWQRVWKISPGLQPDSTTHLWKPADDLDAITIRGLYQSLVPQLVQSAEPPLKDLGQGWVYADHDELLAFVSPTYGPQGIYLQPLIHPGVESVETLLASLIGSLPMQFGRPVYLSVRSYQAWLENALAGCGAKPAARQALLVKHLAALQRMPAYAASRSALEKQQPAMLETTDQNGAIPLVQMQDHEPQLKKVAFEDPLHS